MIIWTGSLRHVIHGIAITAIEEKDRDQGDMFVIGAYRGEPFKALLHRHVTGEMWFYGPRMQCVYMSHFREEVNTQ